MSPTTESLIEARVSWLDEEMDATLASASPDLDLYRWSRYHLGWMNDRLEPMPPADRRRHGGKRLRGVLTILATEAMGGGGHYAAAAGAAIEFIHNFSLVHDDVEDNDAERRHRPTVWKLWGIPQAINVGSNMQAMVDLAVLRLAEIQPAERVIEVQRIVSRAVVQMTEGQYMDMAAEDAAEMSLEQYFRMTGGKTAALIEAGLWVGALLGTSDPERIAAMARFGRSFGLAFQCRDDFLGIWGEPRLTGKPVGSDVLQGKRSLPVVHALAQAPAGTEPGDRLRSALADRSVPSVLAVLEEVGTADWVRARVHDHTQDAVSALDASRPEEPHGTAIRDIADYALGRES
jgi:geranylgeranyl diphosphate synthase type I